MSSAPTTTDRWLSWQLRHPGGAPVPLFHQALRTRSEAALDALVTMATDGVHSSDTLLARVLDGSVPDPTPDLLRQQALAGVAFTWAGRQRDAQELAGAAAIFIRLWDLGAMASYGHQLKLTSLQTLFLAGRYRELATLLPRVDGLHPDGEHYLRTDLAHPRVYPDGPDDAWSELLSARFVESSLAPLDLLDSSPHPGQAPFDRLAAPSAAAGTAGGQGLVTVVMPCWRPDEGLITSVRSITSQTYADLEIILVDDCSGPGHRHIFAEAAAQDSRVRILTLPRNGGSYLCRAAAIAASTGPYITFQDADDWSHPSRIELQVAALEDVADAPASRSLAVRAKDDLTHQWLGYRAIRANASSLLIRREVLRRTGGFIPVRKGADSEFADRVALLEGPVVDLPVPLAITRLRSGSLSRGDFTFSWMAPDRYRFRAAFTAWHRRLHREAQDGRTVSVSDEELATLPFPVPPSWVRDLDAAARTPTSFSTAYLGVFSHPVPTRGSRWLLDRLASAPQDEPVGLWHQEPRATSSALRPHLAHDWDDLLLEGVVHPISRMDASTVRRLVVLDPAVVTLHRDQPVVLEVERIDVWLTPELVTPDGSALPEDLLQISDAILQHWGSRPRWLLAPWLTPLERAQVREAVPGLPVDEARA